LNGLIKGNKKGARNGNSRNHIQACPLTFLTRCGFGQLSQAKAKLLPSWRVDLVGSSRGEKSFWH